MTRTIQLTTRQRHKLEALLKERDVVPRKRVRARVLLLSDLGWSRGDITTACGASTATIGRTRRRFRDEGLDAALQEAPRTGAPAKISASDEQRIAALACTVPPDGRSRWTVRLLTEEVIKQRLVKSIARERVRLILRGHGLKPWREKNVVHSRAD